jgi:hypothetical protein
VVRRIVTVVKGNLLEAYLDESGTHKGSPILAVAGYFGTHDQWNVFLDKWKCQEFHACDPRFDGFKPQLAEAIDASEIEGGEVCLRPNEFEESASSDMKSNMGNAYAVAVFMWVTGICKLVTAENEDARIALVLEDGQPNIEWVQRLLIAFIAELPTIASVTVRSKTGVPQLHPADFLVHSRSTTDTAWMERLFAKRRVREMPIERDLFEITSAEVARLLRENRRNKARAKLARKIGI